MCLPGSLWVAMKPEQPWRNPCCCTLLACLADSWAAMKADLSPWRMSFNPILSHYGMCLPGSLWVAMKPEQHWTNSCCTVLYLLTWQTHGQQWRLIWVPGECLQQRSCSHIGRCSPRSPVHPCSPPGQIRRNVLGICTWIFFYKYYPMSSVHIVSKFF